MIAQHDGYSARYLLSTMVAQHDVCDVVCNGLYDVLCDAVMLFGNDMCVISCVMSCVLSCVMSCVMFVCGVVV